jgi:ribosome biogenesis protein YTM1
VGEAIYVIDRETNQEGKRPVGGEGLKVFGVQWDKEVGIVSGGEDKMVQINRGRGITKGDD